MEPDSFLRRTATPAALVPWLVELVGAGQGLVDSYAAGGSLGPRAREELILAVTDVAGCRYCAWAHGWWAEFLGAVEGEGAPESARLYARSSAAAGQPLDPDGLTDALGKPLARAVRATVAQANILNLIGNTVDGLIARATGKRRLEPGHAAVEMAVVAAAVPMTLSRLGTAAVLRSISRLAPPRVGVRTSDATEPNLLVHVLGEALAPFDANAALRLAVAHSPVVLVIGIRTGQTSATVRIGRGEVALENGLAPDALIVIEGNARPLLRLAMRPLVRDLAHLRLRHA